MQEPNAALVSGIRGRMMEPVVDDDEYIRTLCRAILTRVTGPRVRVLRDDLARGVVDAYRWHILLKDVDGDDSARSAIRAVILAINRSH